MARALAHFVHPESDQYELFPYRPTFTHDVMQTASSLIEKEGRQAVIVADLRSCDDMNSASDTDFWNEVRRAIKWRTSWGLPLTD